MKKKFLAVLACMLAVPMVMGGCSGDSANSSAPASSDEASSSAEASSSSGETVKITAWLNAPLENEMAYYEAFSEKYPQYEIEYTLYQDDELKEQTTIAIQAGTAPKILRPKVGSQLNDLIAAGACADLNSYSEQYGWKDMSYEDIYDACSKDGVLYAIPRSTGGYWQTLYYNADMAKELGLDLKQDMTIDEFIALKDTVNGAGYQLLSFGNLDRWPGVIMMGDYFMQVATPQLIDDLNSGAVKWNDSPEVLEVFGTLQKLGQSGAFITGFESSDHLSVNQSWASGKTLFMYCGTWWPESVTGGRDGVPFEIHTVSLPKIDAGTELQGQMFFANDAYAVYSGASDAEKEAAAAWLDYSFNFDGCKAKFADSAMYTVNKSFNESMEELGMEMDPLFQEEAFTKQMDLPQMNLADWAFDTSVIEELKLRIVDLFAGTMTPKQAADSVAAVAAEVIGE